MPNQKHNPFNVVFNYFNDKIIAKQKMLISLHKKIIRVTVNQKVCSSHLIDCELLVTIVTPKYGVTSLFWCEKHAKFSASYTKFNVTSDSKHCELIHTLILN